MDELMHPIRTKNLDEAPQSAKTGVHTSITGSLATSLAVADMPTPLCISGRHDTNLMWRTISHKEGMKGRTMARAKKIHGITMIREDEYEVFSTHASMVPTLLKGIPILIAAVAITVIAHLWRHEAQVTTIVGLVTAAIVIATRVPGCLHALVEPIVVSNRRLYLRKGLIDIDDHIASLSNISDIQVDPTILGRMFGYADVTIQTIAGEQDFSMKDVRRAYALRDHILRISDESQYGGGMYNNQGGYPQQNQSPQQGYDQRYDRQPRQGHQEYQNRRPRR